MGQAWTTPVQGLTHDVTWVPRGAEGLPLASRPVPVLGVRRDCFLRLRGRSPPAESPTLFGLGKSRRKEHCAELE